MMIELKTWLALVAIVAVMSIVACNKDMTVEDMTAAATKAYKENKFEEAYRLNHQIHYWEGTQLASADLRLKAAIDKCRCLVHMGRYKYAVMRFKDIAMEFNEYNLLKETYHPILRRFASDFPNSSAIKRESGLEKQYEKYLAIEACLELLDYTMELLPEKKEAVEKRIGSIVEMQKLIKKDIETNITKNIKDRKWLNAMWFFRNHTYVD